jgi:hypothetical protein
MAEEIKFRIRCLFSDRTKVRSTKFFHFPFFIFHFFLLLIAPALQAHQLDEYLQSTLISIDQNKITLSINLTPGISIAQKVLPRIDTNHDRTISTIEAQAYCEKFKNDLTIGIDGHRAFLKLEGFNVPDYADLTNGFGMIQTIYSIEAPLRPGEHKLTFENHHMLGIGNYLLNAAKPKSDLIQILSQKRNETQSIGTIEFKLEPTKSRRTITVISLIGVWAAMFAAVWRLQSRRVTSPS